MKCHTVHTWYTHTHLHKYINVLVCTAINALIDFISLAQNMHTRAIVVVKKLYKMFFVFVLTSRGLVVSSLCFLFTHANMLQNSYSHMYVCVCVCVLDILKWLTCVAVYYLVWLRNTCAMSACALSASTVVCINGCAIKYVPVEKWSIV